MFSRYHPPIQGRIFYFYRDQKKENEKDCFYGGILPTGKSFSVYTYKAGTGHKNRDFNHQGKMGVGAWACLPLTSVKTITKTLKKQ